MANQWFKFYGGEFLADPKMGSLSAQERSCWITLMCLASTSSTQGLIEYLTIEVLLEKSGIHFDPYSPEEWNALLGVLSKFENMKMLKKHDNGVIEIRNWSKRQEFTMTATERSRKHRAKQKDNTENATDETQRNENATLEENRIEENRLSEPEGSPFTVVLDEEEGKRKTPPKYPNAPAVLKLFKIIGNVPANWKINTAQLKACENLYKERGLEKIESALEFYSETRDQEYCPQITTPFDLDSKWTKLGQFKLKQ